MFGVIVHVHLKECFLPLGDTIPLGQVSELVDGIVQIFCTFTHFLLVLLVIGEISKYNGGHVRFSLQFCCFEHISGVQVGQRGTVIEACI